MSPERPASDGRQQERDEDVRLVADARQARRGRARADRVHRPSVGGVAQEEDEHDDDGDEDEDRDGDARRYGSRPGTLKSVDADRLGVARATFVRPRKIASVPSVVISALMRKTVTEIRVDDADQERRAEGEHEGDARIGSPSANGSLDEPAGRRREERHDHRGERRRSSRPTGRTGRRSAAASRGRRRCRCAPRSGGC